MRFVEVVVPAMFALGIIAVGCSSESGGGSSSSTSSSGGATSSGSSSSSTSSSSSGGSSGDAGTDAGKLPFGSPCTDDAQCQGGACHLFSAKGGKFCTQPCPASAAQCPNGGAGCTGDGTVCKVP